MMQNITLRALQEHILATPELRALAIMPEDGKVPGAHLRDRDIAAAINATNWGASSREVESWQAKKLLIKRGKWFAIVEASLKDGPARASAFAAVELANDARMTVDFLDESAPALMGPLVAAGLLSVEDIAALRDLCRVAPTFTADDVSRALRGPW